MKKLNKRFTLNLAKGFTLIELLIVIALLGALAVGLLAALDPFEQLKKGTDTGTRNTVSEIHGAVIRYYAIKNHMPWCDAADCSTYEDGQGNAITDVAADDLADTLQNIIDSGELKTDFMTLAANQLPNIFIFGDNGAASIQVCYKPTSKSFTADPNTKFDEDTGVDGCTSTPNDPAGSPCYWCVK